MAAGAPARPLRYREIQGDTGRYREIWGDLAVHVQLAHEGGAAQLGEDGRDGRAALLEAGQARAAREAQAEEAQDDLVRG